jgi:kynurenine formamidase
MTPGPQIKNVFVDLSLPLTSDLPGFPGYPGFESQQLHFHDQDGKVSHSISLTTHTGTHIDAPEHFVPHGASIDEVPLERLIGEYRVADLRSHSGERITASMVADALGEVEAGTRILLVTGDVDRHFDGEDFFDQAAVLSIEAAEWLVDNDVAAVGNDFLTESIDNPDRPVHHALLEADIPTVEYLCNTEEIADQRTVWLHCLPLSIPGVEAAPARVIAADRPAPST